MPWYIPPSSGSTVPSSPATPPPAKTANYTFTAADDGVPILFNAAGAPLTGNLPDPATVAGCTFIAKKIDASVNGVNLIGNIDGMNPYSLTDEGASVIMMATAAGYMIVAAYSP